MDEILASMRRYFEHETRVEATALAQERIYRYSIERSVRMASYAAAWQCKWDTARRDHNSGNSNLRYFRSANS